MHVFRAKLINLLVDMISLLNLPISIVERAPFIKFVDALNCKFKIPCRQVLSSKLIPERTEVLRAILRKDLEHIKFCSATCDGWTSVSNQSYLGVTVHYVKNYKLQSYLLSLRHIKESHTSQKLISELRDIFNEWNLVNKVLCISADGAANIKKVRF